MFWYSLLVREYVSAAVQFLFQNIINTCKRSRQFFYEDYLQLWIPQSQWNVHHGHNHIITIFVMGARGSTKGYGNLKRISFLPGFSFPLRLEPWNPWQLNVIAICARKEKPLYNLAMNPAIYTSDCNSTSSGRHNLHHANIQSNVIFGAPD